MQIWIGLSERQLHTRSQTRCKGRSPNQTNTTTIIFLPAKKLKTRYLGYSLTMTSEVASALVSMSNDTEIVYNHYPPHDSVSSTSHCKLMTVKNAGGYIEFTMMNPTKTPKIVTAFTGKYHDNLYMSERDSNQTKKTKFTETFVELPPESKTTVAVRGPPNRGGDESTKYRFLVDETLMLKVANKEGKGVGYFLTRTPSVDKCVNVYSYPNFDCTQQNEVSKLTQTTQQTNQQTTQQTNQQTAQQNLSDDNRSDNQKQQVSQISKTQDSPQQSNAAAFLQQRLKMIASSWQHGETQQVTVQQTQQTQQVSVQQTTVQHTQQAPVQQTHQPQASQKQQTSEPKKNNKRQLTYDEAQQTHANLLSEIDHLSDLILEKRRKLDKCTALLVAWKNVQTLSDEL